MVTKKLIDLSLFLLGFSIQMAVTAYILIESEIYTFFQLSYLALN